MSFIVEKDWTHKCLRCVVIATDFGHRCGYVGVEEGHPLYNLDYTAPTPDSLQKYVEKVKNSPIGKRGIIDIFCSAGDETLRVGLLFDVHGGITYSDGGNYPVKSNPQLWWFGYDCGHSGDAKDRNLMSKKYLEIELKYELYNDGVVRDLAYCTQECENLADQLMEVGSL